MMKRIVALVFVVFAVSGCANNASIGTSSQSGTNYVAGDGSLTYINADKRGTSISLKGTTLDGKPLDINSWRGNVVVVNFWASWCGPCRAEAATLANSFKEFSNKNVEFVGLNTRDGIAAARAFNDRFPTGYPSVADQDGKLILNFGNLGPAATPTTLVLDPAGRIAARILGPVTQAQLRSVIHAVIADATP